MAATIGAALFAVARVQAAPSSMCGPAPEIGEPSEDQRIAYEKAKKDAENGEYAKALAGFENAYKASPSYVILFNIGKAAEHTGDTARALRAYTCHLEHGGSSIDATRKAEVTTLIEGLKKKVAFVMVEADELGAEVMIDSDKVATIPLDDAVPVNPGERHLVR